MTRTARVHVRIEPEVKEQAKLPFEIDEIKEKEE